MLFVLCFASELGLRFEFSEIIPKIKKEFGAKRNFLKVVSLFLCLLIALFLGVIIVSWYSAYSVFDKGIFADRIILRGFFYGIGFIVIPIFITCLVNKKPKSVYLERTLVFTIITWTIVYQAGKVRSLVRERKEQSEDIHEIARLVALAEKDYRGTEIWVTTNSKNITAMIKNSSRFIATYNATYNEDLIEKIRDRNLKEILVFPKIVWQSSYKDFVQNSEKSKEELISRPCISLKHQNASSV